MSTWFTSDLHLGHVLIAQTRGFTRAGVPDANYHDWELIENINSRVHKRDKLFILGDVAFTDAGLQRLGDIRCRNIEVILGNHDKYPLKRYLQYVQKIHGFRGYRDYWLSHCPIHPAEIREKAANIHGHVHVFSDTEKIEDQRYYNVNVEFHKFFPVSLDKINVTFEAKS